TLRYKYKEGDKLRYLLDLNLSMKMTIMNMEVDAGGGIKLTTSQHVRSVDKDGNAKVLMKIERMQMDVEALGMKMSFENADENNLPPGLDKDTIKAILSDGMTMTMDPLGNVSDTKYPESWKKLAEGAGGVPGLDFSKMSGGTGNQVDLVLPKENVIKGQGW